MMEQNAPLILTWMRKRGGVAVWGSLNLSDPGKTWTTPVRAEDGTPAPKPHWGATNEPLRVITDMDNILVDTPKEVKRFHVAVRTGAQGMSLKVSDGGSRRIKKEVAKAGEEAWYEFDYDTQEAVVYVPDATETLQAWAGRKGLGLGL